MRQVLVTLFHQLTGERRLRLLGKFVEDEMSKLDRMLKVCDGARRRRRRCHRRCCCYLIRGTLRSDCIRAGTWWGAAAVPASESLYIGAWCARENQQPAGRIAAPLIRRHSAQCDRVALTCGEGDLTHRRQLAVTRAVESDAWEIGGRSAGDWREIGVRSA